MQPPRLRVRPTPLPQSVCRLQVHRLLPLLLAALHLLPLPPHQKNAQSEVLVDPPVDRVDPVDLQ